MLGIWFAVLWTASAAAMIGLIIRMHLKQKKKTEQYGMPEMTLQQFYSLKQSQQDFAGIYVLHNMTKDMYYVGQSVAVFSRVAKHFHGHGNGDVYADYRYGDRFMIQVLPLKQSGSKTLNELERKMIARYHAYDEGYNKTHGNQ